MNAPAPFDAALDFSPDRLGAGGRAVIIAGGRKVPASLVVYAIPGKAGAGWVHVRPDRPVEVKWRETFEVVSNEGRPLGGGTVLLPSAPDPAEVKTTRKKRLLEAFSQGEREMLLALAVEKTVQGLGGGEAAAFSGLSRDRLEAVARELEQEGSVRILSFAPLFIVSSESLEFLRRRIAVYLAAYHKKHPGQRGAPLERLAARFPSNPKILLLAVRALVKEGKAGMDKGVVWLSDFRIPLTADDEKILAELEDRFLAGELGSISLDDIRREFHLSQGKLQTLLTVLTEREKIVEGRDGFILHAKWLDEIVKKIHESGKRELTVADFKAMTGLSRKYAIPLLELLDEMGVTRRKGAVRDIL